MTGVWVTATFAIGFLVDLIYDKRLSAEST